jgi:AcrR family transcriptional regulator
MASRAAAKRDEDRRIGLLDAAASVFLRFGYRKASMDDVAAAAGLSRQALYLRFANKDELFRAAVQHVLDSSLDAARTALRAPGDVSERIVNAYAALHGAHLGDAAGAQVMAELVDVAATLIGPSVHGAADPFIDDVAKVLAPFKARGVSARDMAATIDAASRGIKHTVQNLGSYRREMARVVRVVLANNRSKR